jgi:hypothetical protein
MDAGPNVEKLIRETKRYEFADGLRDLQMAVVWAAMGVTTWFVFERAEVWFPFVLRLADAVGRWARWTSMLLVFVPAILAFGALALVAYARRRWLWRESGWVRPLRQMVPRQAAVISTAIGLGIILLGFVLYRLGVAGEMFALRMLVLAAHWMTAYTMIALGRHLDLPRYVWLGVIGGLVSTPMPFLPLTFGQTWLAFGIWWGLVLAASGVVTLRHRLIAMREVGGDG